MGNRKYIAIVITAVTLLFLVLGAPVALPVLFPGFGSSLTADEVAKVNGVGITRQALTEYTGRLASKDNQVNMPEGEEGRQLEMQALDELVNEELLNQLAAKRGLSVSDEELDAKLQDIKVRNYQGDESKMQQAMVEQGVTYPEARERLRQAMLAEMLQQQVVEEATDISEAQVEDFYNNNQDYFKEPETRNLRHILTSSQEAALAARTRLVGGADVGTVAKEVSLDSVSRDNGGDLGWVARGVTSPAFDQMAFSLAQGVWSDPVNTPSGWNIIKVEQIRSSRVPPLDDIRGDVRAKLVGEQGDSSWNNWLNEQRTSAEIEFASGYNPQQESGEALPAGHP